MVFGCWNYLENVQQTAGSSNSMNKSAAITGNVLMGFAWSVLHYNVVKSFIVNN